MPPAPLRTEDAAPAARRPARGIRYVLDNLKTLPNQITATRLALIPVLWVLALQDRPVWLGVGLGIAASTDILDGWLSRRWGQTSAFGSRLDSLADHLLTASTLAWLLLLEGDFFRAQRVPLLLWVGLALATLAVSRWRYGRWADLHLYSSKLAVVLGFVFAVALLVQEEYSRPLWWATFALATLAVLESLAVILTRPRVDEHIGSILLPRRRRRAR
ncbi:MAG TPA: CDP-alcohol phosphatidyltransferase family protein [Longimicrobiaceae bacterium]|nr:CDP-alcohol phosphatidyltransferase family protein [Longimicrobiaceae bacterium]